MGLRLKTVRSHVQASWDRPTKDEFGNLYAWTTKLRIYDPRTNLRFTLKQNPLSAQIYLLDTNIVLHATRQNSPVSAALDAQFRLSRLAFRPAVCEVSIGGLSSFARGRVSDGAISCAELSMSY